MNIKQKKEHKMIRMDFVFLHRMKIFLRTEREEFGKNNEKENNKLKSKKSNNNKKDYDIIFNISVVGEWCGKRPLCDKFI